MVGLLDLGSPSDLLRCQCSPELLCEHLSHVLTRLGLEMHISTFFIEWFPFTQKLGRYAYGSDFAVGLVCLWLRLHVVEECLCGMCMLTLYQNMYR
jgi:hypothetical protein